MADSATRRADSYRRYADQLTEAAQLDINKNQRRHLLDLAGSYRRAADHLAPQPPPRTDDPFAGVFPGKGRQPMPQ